MVGTPTFNVQRPISVLASIQYVMAHQMVTMIVEMDQMNYIVMVSAKK